MRDVNRIDDYCKRLAEMWKKVPDWRFGQFMCNILGYTSTKLGDPFFPEDEELFTEMESYFTPEEGKHDSRI